MRFISLLAVLTMAAGAHAAVENYKVDPAHTSIVFKISHLGFSHVYGMFTEAEGKFSLDSASPGKSMLEVSVPVSSVFTHEKKRDEHLSSPDFFNVKQFPTIIFKSKTMKKVDASHWQVTGDLTLHGVTKPVSFELTQGGTGKDPMGNTRTGGDAMLKIKRSDYGMTFMNDPTKVGDDVEIWLSVEGTKI